MIPDDVYELAWAGDPRISPDGRTVAFVVTRIDRRRTTTAARSSSLPADGSTPPRKLTAGEKRDGSPRWSPDGARLAFVSNRAGDGAQLYVIPLGGGEARRLTDLKETCASRPGRPTARASRSRRGRPIRSTTRRTSASGRRTASLASQYKLDDEGWTGDRPAAYLRRPRGRLGRAGPAHVRRLRGMLPGVVARRRADRVRLGARRRLGHRARLRPLRRRRRTAASRVKLTALGRARARSRRGRPTASLIAFLLHARASSTTRGTRRSRSCRRGRRAARAHAASLDRNCFPYPPMRDRRPGTATRSSSPSRTPGTTHLYRVAADGSARPSASSAATLG